MAHGQSRLWGGPGIGVQGLAELKECERCGDIWLKGVQEEFRNGGLSEDTHGFLHGKPASVPGSWQSGSASCGTKKWQKSLKAKIHKERKRIMKEECEFCKQGRISKHLVLRGDSDKRLLESIFLQAPDVFANNDMKYEVNKLRAKLFAEMEDQNITYVPAKDCPSAEALTERLDLPMGKLQWLQRHD